MRFNRGATKVAVMAGFVGLASAAPLWNTAWACSSMATITAPTKGVGPVDSRLVVSGAQWTVPTVEIHWRSETGPLLGRTVPANGNFSLPITIPNVAPGFYPIKVLGLSGSQVYSAVTIFEVTAPPTTPAPGAAATPIGDGPTPTATPNAAPAIGEPGGLPSATVAPVVSRAAEPTPTRGPDVSVAGAGPAEPVVPSSSRGPIDSSRLGSISSLLEGSAVAPVPPDAAGMPRPLAAPVGQVSSAAAIEAGAIPPPAADLWSSIDPGRSAGLLLSSSDQSQGRAGGVLGLGLVFAGLVTLGGLALVPVRRGLRVLASRVAGG